MPQEAAQLPDDPQERQDQPEWVAQPPNLGVAGHYDGLTAHPLRAVELEEGGVYLTVGRHGLPLRPQALEEAQEAAMTAADGGVGQIAEDFTSCLHRKLQPTR